VKSLIATLLLVLTAAVAWAELPSSGDAEVTQALASGRPTLVDLGSGSCVSCKQMAPILEELAGTYNGKANVLFIDVRENQAAAKRFAIQMIPTQIFFDAKGKEVSRHIGFMGRPDLIKGLQAAGLK
jgi:thioredoxin 1